MVQKFNFSLESLSSEFNDNMKISKAILRAYLQPVRKFLNGNEKIDVQVNITARAISNDSDCIGTTFISSHSMTVSNETQDDWVEWNITRGFNNCWKSYDNISYIEFAIRFRKLHCVAKKKKLPIKIVDPATIPVNDQRRRDRHWPLQPFVLVYVDDEEEKKMMMASQTLKPEEYIIDEVEDHSRTTRAVTPACTIGSADIHFANLGMHHILSPLSYNAKQCMGDCSKRSLDDNVVNNHARLVASAHKMWVDSGRKHNSSSSIPLEPRCVSLTHKYLSLLAVKKDKSVSYRSYPNMIATSCGCRA